MALFSPVNLNQGKRESVAEETGRIRIDTSGSGPALVILGEYLPQASAGPHNMTFVV